MFIGSLGSMLCSLDPPLALVSRARDAGGMKRGEGRESSNRIERMIHDHISSMFTLSLNFLFVK